MKHSGQTLPETEWGIVIGLDLEDSNYNVLSTET
jgi:hypothetical protein